MNAENPSKLNLKRKEQGGRRPLPGRILERLVKLLAGCSCCGKR